MLTIQQIIDEAATLIPNEVPVAQQVVWLNSLNQGFFNVVKIPQIATFTSTTAATYTLPTDVQERNINLVFCGVLKYKSMQEDPIAPLQNAYTFVNATSTLTLIPAPYNSGLTGYVRYDMIATTTFTSSDLTVTPDVPDEWQYSLILGLASYLANTQGQSALAQNYDIQMHAIWSVAAVQYRDGTTNS
jgi:hypothetical protein